MPIIPRSPTNFDSWLLSAIYRLRQGKTQSEVMEQLQKQFPITAEEAAGAVAVAQQSRLQGELAQQAAEGQTVGRAFAVGPNIPDVVNIFGVVYYRDDRGRTAAVSATAGVNRETSIENAKEAIRQMALAEFADTLGGATIDDVVLEIAY